MPRSRASWSAGAVERRRHVRPCSRAAAGSAATASPARSKSSTSRSARSSSGEANDDAEIGQALADRALGRVDQQHRRLEPTVPIDEVGFLPGMLEVVARVGLVGDRVDEVGGADREVDVDVDTRAPAAVVPVVAGPRLARTMRDAQVLAVGQPEVARRAVAEPPDEPVDDAGRRSTGISSRRSQAARRSPVAPSPGSSASSSWSASRRRRRRGAAARSRGTALDVLGVRQRLAGERLGVRVERPELGDQPGAPIRLRRPPPGPVRPARERRRGAARGARSCSMSTRALSSAGPK